MVKILVDLGADVNAKMIDGSTPLHFAAQNIGSDKSVKALIRSGADLESEKKDGKTPLHVAAFHGNLITALLKLDAK